MKPLGQRMRSSNVVDGADGWELFSRMRRTRDRLPRHPRGPGQLFRSAVTSNTSGSVSADSTRARSGGLDAVRWRGSRRRRIRLGSRDSLTTGIACRPRHLTGLSEDRRDEGRRGHALDRTRQSYFLDWSSSTRSIRPGSIRSLSSASHRNVGQRGISAHCRSAVSPRTESPVSRSTCDLGRDGSLRRSRSSRSPNCRRLHAIDK